MVESIAALAVALVVVSAVSPAAVSAIDEGRVRQAAGFMAGQLRLARQHAAVIGSAEALVFDFSGGRWLFRVCRDGNGNGVRRAELGSPDACRDGVHDLASEFPGVRIERDPAIPDPGGGEGSADPVRFGPSDLASFSPSGSATAGSLYLMSRQKVQYAVRTAGVTGRTRLLRYDRSAGQWLEV